jgi:hypothetical protein
MIDRLRDLFKAHGIWTGFAVCVLIGIVIFQGTVLSSDSSSEIELARGLAHFNPGANWHDSRYPLLASILLLPAGLAGVLAGHVAEGFVASVEYLVLGGLTIAVGVRWSMAMRPGESMRDRTEVALVATFATLMWVYVTKEPMDVVMAALFALCAVAAAQEGRLGWASLSLGLLAGSRHQMIPVALVGAVVLIWGPLRRRSLRGVLLAGIPVGISLVLVGLVNLARYGDVLRFGRGYDHIVTYGTDLTTVISSLISIDGGILFFAPLCAVGIIATWPFWRDPHTRPVSAALTVALTIGIFASVVLIHPSGSYLSIWSWGRSCRYFVPLMAITAFLVPRRPRGPIRPMAILATVLGLVWSAPMLLVPYNAQQRFFPLTSPDGPSVWRQYQVIPKVLRNSFDLIVHGTSPYDHSAYFASLWQVETVRSAGQVSLIATGAISVVAAGLAIAIWRAKGPEPSRTPGVASEV